MAGDAEARGRERKILWKTKLISCSCHEERREGRDLRKRDIYCDGKRNSHFLSSCLSQGEAEEGLECTAFFIFFIFITLLSSHKKGKGRKEITLLKKKLISNILAHFHQVLSYGYEDVWERQVYPSSLSLPVVIFFVLFFHLHTYQFFFRNDYFSLPW